jgi:hypothetical protein
MRKEEWKERKKMRAEYEDVENVTNHLSALK